MRERDYPGYKSKRNRHKKRFKGLEAPKKKRKEQGKKIRERNDSRYKRKAKEI